MVHVIAIKQLPDLFQVAVIIKVNDKNKYDDFSCNLGSEPI